MVRISGSACWHIFHLSLRLHYPTGAKEAEQASQQVIEKGRPIIHGRPLSKMIKLN